MRTVCLAEDMPDKTSVFMWMRTNKEFLSQYTRAKEEAADAMYEEIQDISDDGIATIKNSAEKKSGAVAQIVRLQVDTRKWMMSKMKPKKYGEKLDMTSDGRALSINIVESVAKRNKK